MIASRNFLSHANPDEIVSVKTLDQLAASPMIMANPRPARKRLSILFIVKGNGSCLRGGELINLQASTVYTGFTDCFQQFDIGEGTIGYLLSIHPQNLAKVFEKITVVYEGLFAAIIKLDSDHAEEMNWVISRIIKEAESVEPDRAEILHRYVSLLLLRLYSQLKKELVLVSMNRNGRLIKGFFDLLENDFMIAKTVDYYAEKLCVTPKHLSNVLKVASGYPASHHINQRIVLEAKRMAQTTAASMKEIAYELGYEDLSGFSKLFKRVTGETFSAFSRSLKLGFVIPAAAPALTRVRDII